MSFRLTADVLEPATLQAGVDARSSGAVVTFAGRVRALNEGRRVRQLVYEAYAAVAETEGGRIVHEACERFAIEDAVCVHRTGELEVGEVAVWVGVSAPHRDAAFAACRYVIDQVKLRVPIWKKEWYADGNAVWISCNHV